MRRHTIHIRRLKPFSRVPRGHIPRDLPTSRSYKIGRKMDTIRPTFSLERHLPLHLLYFVRCSSRMSFFLSVKVASAYSGAMAKNIALYCLISQPRLAATLGSPSNFKMLPRRSILNVNISSLGNLPEQPEEPLVLRLSSNLMIGVTRCAP